MGVTLGISTIIAVFFVVLLILKQLLWRSQVKNIEGKHVVVIALFFFPIQTSSVHLAIKLIII